MPTTALTVRASTAIAQGEPVVGRPAVWARDMAAMGGLSMGLLVLLGNGLQEPGLLATLTAAGAGFGLLLGGGLAWSLERLRGRLSLPNIYALGTLATGLWCVLSVGSAALWLGERMRLTDIAELLVVGSLLGVALLGWLWFAYTVASVLRLRRWPLLALVLPWTGIIWLVFRLAMGS